MIKLKKLEYKKIFYLKQNQKIQKNIKHAIIFGNEVKGVSQNAINLSNDVIEIPQYGTKHSLNVSACSAILIWEFFNALN